MALPHWFARERDVLEPDAWLGVDAQARLDNGDLAGVWTQLRRWQERIGAPGDDVSPRLLRDATESLMERDGCGLGAGEGRDALETTRQRLADTLMPVQRAYLLNTTFTVGRSWMLTDSFDAGSVRKFLDGARRWATVRDVPFRSEFTPPERVVGRFGFSGHASFSVTGNAHQLQGMLDDLMVSSNFAGVRRERLRSDAILPIPHHAAAAAVAGGFVTVDAPLLHQDLALRGERTAALLGRLQTAGRTVAAPHTGHDIGSAAPTQARGRSDLGLL